MRPPEPIGPQHQLEGFDCGNAALNLWLQQRALANERQGVSRTVVLCPGEGNDVIAYACLSAGAVLLAEVPGALRRNMPDPLPVVVLGCLAVDRRHQGQGLGRALVADALRRSLAARRLIGAEPCWCTRSMSRQLHSTALWDFAPRRSAPRRGCCSSQILLPDRRPRPPTARSRCCARGRSSWRSAQAGSRDRQSLGAGNQH